MVENERTADVINALGGLGQGFFLEEGLDEDADEQYEKGVEEKNWGIDGHAQDSFLAGEACVFPSNGHFRFGEHGVAHKTHHHHTDGKTVAKGKSEDKEGPSEVETARGLADLLQEKDADGDGNDDADKEGLPPG